MTCRGAGFDLNQECSEFVLSVDNFEWIGGESFAFGQPVDLNADPDVRRREKVELE